MFNVKSLFGKSGDNDPLANRKMALQWLGGLPADDITTAQGQIVDHLKQLADACPSAREEVNRLEIIDALDHHIQTFQATLCEQYLRSPRMSQTVENRLWTVIYGYYFGISQLYLQHLQAQIGNRELRQNDALLLRLCLRGLYNLGFAFKWRFLRYSLPDNEMWSMLNGFYLIAETQGFENQPQTVYDAREFRCSSLLLRTELLALAHPGSLLPDQIEYLDRWLLDSTESMTLERQPRTERHHYFIDLAEAQGALPVSAVSYPHTCRAWDMSTLLIRLQHSRATLGPNAAPRSALDPAQRQKMLATFSHAEKQWYPAHLGKLRKNPRIKANRHLNAVHGLPALCNNVRRSMEESPGGSADSMEIKYNEMVDLQMYGFVTESTRNRHQSLRAPLKIQEPVEHWESENESANGYLVRFPVGNSNWMHLGSLIGVRQEGSPDWKATVVRRLIKTQQTTAMAGLEIIAQQPVPITLLPIQSDPQTLNVAPSATGQTINQALMTRPLHDTQFTLIIDSVNYARSRLYKFQMVAGQPFTYFRLGQIIEKGDLWVHAEAMVIREEHTDPAGLTG